MNATEHEHFMQLALAAAARAAAEDEVPVGAVAVYQGEVLAQAHNQREQRQDPLSHAEIHVIQAAAQKLGSWRLADVTVYVTLEPCLMCMGALLQARVPRLVFGALDPKAGACGSLYQVAEDPRLNHRIKVIAGVLAEEASVLLRDFFRQKRTKS